jgi:hypothetical protein
MKKLNNFFKLLPLSLLICSGAIAQSIPTLELSLDQLPTNSGFGVSTLPMTATFINDASNNGVFTTNTPPITVTVSFRNQQFSGLNYGAGNTAQSTGLVFGAGPSLATDPVVFGAYPYNRYNIIGQYGGNGGPTDNMFTSNPTAFGAQLGTGIAVKDANQINGGFEVFTTAQSLFGSANGIGSRVYFGDLVVRFSSPQKNPVIHIAGLGGSYRYLPLGLSDVSANYLSTFFSSELELQNTGLTSTLMSGNTFMQLSGNNILNSNDANPNGGSILDPLEQFNNFGAATGSVRLNGTVQEVVYKVYLQSGTASQFAWSVPGSLIQGATKDPFTGDIWYVSASLDKPTQQLSGNVFNDKDGLNGTGDINTSAGVANPGTNAGGVLYANLLNSAGNVVATTPVSSDGSYLFDGIPAGTYSVQLSQNSGAGTFALPQTPPATILPATWVNTGEFNSNAPGSDGTVNGISTPVTILAGDIKTEVNFGIERLPESVSFNRFLSPTPGLNQIYTLNTTTLPTLEGSDPEDQLISGSLSGKTVLFTAVPSTYAQLRYNGAAIPAGTTITNFNPALLSIKFIAIGGPDNTQFSYAYVDAAGKADPTPAVYIIRYSSGGVLPVSITAFDVTKQDCTAKLAWQTSIEINTNRFEVEVSDNNVDFAKFATVTATGNSTTVQNYSTGYAMKSGVLYYFRLRVVDNDGTYAFSAVRKMSCDGKGTIVIAPNPVYDMFKISGMKAGKNIVSVYSNDGKLLQTQTITNINGVVDIAKFPAGVYLVRVANENGSVTSDKVIKR